MTGPNIPTRVMMFRDFVPDKLRVFLCLFLALSFQFSGGIYLSSVSQMVGSLALMQEDIMMAGYASMTGLTMAFPLLFRILFRFQPRSLLLFSAGVFIVSDYLCMVCDFLPLVVLLSFVSGFFKIVGTFVCWSNVQLKITPKRDFAVFFPFLFTFVLGSVQLANIVTGYSLYAFDWRAMHRITIGAFIVVFALVYFGMRRNYQWEPVPWDGEIMEDTVQGMSQIKEEGRPVGSVEIYMSRRLTNEECALTVRAEAVRFGLNSLFFSCLLIWLLRRYGDLTRLLHFLQTHWQGRQAEQEREEPVSAGELAREGAPVVPPAPASSTAIDLEKGRRYMNAHRESVRITAGLFRQSFRGASALMGRLFARGAVAELSHLGRLLEVAAPCLGADKLTEAAGAMQRALNDPQCETPALAVEACAQALDEVLAALA